MITKDEAVAALGNMTVLEIIALTKHLENVWGVEAKPAPVVRQIVTGPEETRQTEFTVNLVSVPAAAKMTVIKLVKEVLGLGLKDAKDLVEAAPKPLKDSVDAAEAESLRAKFTEAGAVVEVK